MALTIGALDYLGSRTLAVSNIGSLDYWTFGGVDYWCSQILVILAIGGLDYWWSQILVASTISQQ